MRTKDPIIAKLVSDVHLSQTPPIMRSVEKNWLKVQKGYLDQLKAIHADDLFLPTIMAGDILHSPNASPEFINFLIEYFPEVYAIPGNHDLPHHRLADIRKSAYWTLVKIRRIRPIPTDGTCLTLPVNGKFDRPLNLWGFTVGQKIRPRPGDKLKGAIDLAVIHRYVWMKEHRYKDAPEAQRLKNYLAKLKGYNAALFGDNHKGFLYQGKIDILNVGTFMRRRTEEIDYRPRVGLLHASGKITTKYLNVSKDKIWPVKVKTVDGEELNLEDFIEDLERLTRKTTDVHEAVKRYLNILKVDKKTKQWILDLIP